ncbi:Ribosome-binding factor A [Geodia barretti]|uniref:Ribosome-binding factor A n=1 Tax=Geodia barretti TaxID=519541 RepID=A0AA35WAY0_GEOBA|nr:Ribosome-binding factor A [Geodia barretti]
MARLAPLRTGNPLRPDAGHIRPQRVGDAIRAELATLLQRQVRDPAVRQVAVTRVRMSRDLELAQVYYTLLPGDVDLRGAARGLRRAQPFLRRQLGRIGLRRVPELRFLHDDAVEEQDRVARLLDEIAATPPSDADDPPGEDA